MMTVSSGPSSGASLTQAATVTPSRGCGAEGWPKVTSPWAAGPWKIEAPVAPRRAVGHEAGTHDLACDLVGAGVAQEAPLS